MLLRLQLQFNLKLSWLRYYRLGRNIQWDRSNTVVYFILSEVSLKRRHCMKESQPLSKHSIIEIVYTTNLRFID